MRFLLLTSSSMQKVCKLIDKIANNERIYASLQFLRTNCLTQCFLIQFNSKQCGNKLSFFSAIEKKKIH